MEDRTIEEIVLTSWATYVILGLLVLVGLVEAAQFSSVFTHAIDAVDWAVVAVVMAFGAITTLLIQSVLTPGAQTAANKRDFVVARFWFWTAFLAFFVAVLLFFGPNGVLTYNRPDYNQYLVLHKNETTSVCGTVANSYGNMINKCFSVNGTDFLPLNDSTQLPTFLSNANWSSQPKSFPTVFYKQG